MEERRMPDGEESEGKRVGVKRAMALPSSSS